MPTQTELVFAELLAELGEQQRRLVEQLSGPGDEQSILEVHKWILSILQVATDTQVWADPTHPRFVDIVGPYKKWGGDNADAFYCYAPVDLTRTYRVQVRPGNAVYLSLTVYGGPNDGHYSERIVGSLNDRQAPPGPDGVIRMVLSPDDPGSGMPWIRLEPDAVAIVTRDYLADPIRDARAAWEIAADESLSQAARGCTSSECSDQGSPPSARFVTFDPTERWARVPTMAEGGVSVDLLRQGDFGRAPLLRECLDSDDLRRSRLPRRGYPSIWIHHVDGGHHRSVVDRGTRDWGRGKSLQPQVEAPMTIVDAAGVPLSGLSQLPDRQPLTTSVEPV